MSISTISYGKRRIVSLEKLIRRWLPRITVTAMSFALGCSSARPPATEVATGQQPASSAVNQINESLSLMASQSRSSTADYRIGPEDLVQITLYNIPEQDARVTPRQVILRVSQDGMIILPLIGAIAAKGKTISQLQEELGKKYEKYIRNPNVGVLITEYHQRVSVMGAVQKPGIFELTSPKTVIDMVAMAGGINEKAGNQVMLYRQDPDGKRQTAVIDLLVLANPAGQVTDPKDSAMVNMPVQAGDVINVPQAGMYFVDGAVRRPGSYPIGRQFTLTQALATAGGVDPELADYSGVSIYRRRSPTNTETINVDLDNVREHKSEDLQVQPDDVILVPVSGMKYFVKRFVGTLFSVSPPIR
jgi:polysaccharide export outer membrane protein